MASNRDHDSDSENNYTLTTSGDKPWSHQDCSGKHLRADIAVVQQDLSSVDRQVVPPSGSVQTENIICSVHTLLGRVHYSK